MARPQLAETRGHAPGLCPMMHSDIAEQPAAGDGRQRERRRSGRCLPRLSRSVGLTACGGVVTHVSCGPCLSVLLKILPTLWGGLMGLLTLQTIFQEAFPAYERMHPLPAHVRRAARAIMLCRTA